MERIKIAFSNIKIINTWECIIFMKKEKLTIIGTAHVSKKSVDEIKKAIYEQKPDVVAIELDKERYYCLLQEKKANEVDEKISMMKIIKKGKIGFFMAGYLLNYVQREIGERHGIKPGSEFVAAIQAAKDINAKIALIDRDVNITLQRALNKVTWREMMKFLYGIIISFFSNEDEVDVEQLKESDILDEIMEYFKDMCPNAYKVLVTERDAYLANNILNIKEDHVIAIVGAGHKKGINYYLENPTLIS